MKSKLLNSFIVVVLIILILIIVRNPIIRVGLEQYVRVVTGLRLSIGTLDIGLIEPAVNIKNLRIYNPAGYADPVMADVGEIHLRYKLSDMLKGKIYLKEFRFSLKEVSIIRRSGNYLNFDAFNAFGHGGNGSSLQLTIDDFILNIGKVVYKDYSQVPTPLVKEYNLNLNEHYKGIHGTHDLVHLIMVSVLSKTSIASSIQVDLNRLKEGLSSTLLKSLQVSDNSIKSLLNNL